VDDNMTATQLAPVLGRKSLDNTYQYAGGTVSILIAGEDTGGVFSLWEGVQKPGSEPPLHVHHTSGETFYVLEGHIRFMIGDQIHEAGPGDAVFAPRGIPHAFKIKSDVARAITVCTPSGFEEWFLQMGRPAKSFDLPEHVASFSEADFAKMQVLSKQLHTEVIEREVDF
jgi:quercetin dioxygenase-like cupin family protein